MVGTDPSLHPRSVFNVLKLWVKNNYADFAANESLLNMLRDFLPKMKADFHRGTEDFEALLNRKAKGDENTYLSQSNALPPSPILPKNLLDFCFLDLDPVELARQITLLQWTTFRSIKPNECLNQSWNKKELHQYSPHIREMIQFCNFVCFTSVATVTRSSYGGRWSNGCPPRLSRARFQRRALQRYVT